MKREARADDLDFVGTMKAIPELIMTLLPPLLLFVGVEVVVYQLLFFMPESWQWTVRSEGLRGLSGTEVVWTARVLLTLMISLPLTMFLYIKLKKRLRRRAR